MVGWDTSLSKLRETVKDKEACCSSGVAKSHARLRDGTTIKSLLHRM